MKLDRVNGHDDYIVGDAEALVHGDWSDSWGIGRTDEGRMPMNREWHAANRMPKNATLDQRIAWHEARAQACGCRPIPPMLLEEIDRRQQRSR